MSTCSPFLSPSCWTSTWRGTRKGILYVPWTRRFLPPRPGLFKPWSSWGQGEKTHHLTWNTNQRSHPQTQCFTCFGCRTVGVWFTQENRGVGEPGRIVGKCEARENGLYRPYPGPETRNGFSSVRVEIPTDRQHPRKDRNRGLLKTPGSGIRTGSPRKEGRRHPQDHDHDHYGRAEGEPEGAPTFPSRRTFSCRRTAPEPPSIHGIKTRHHVT